MTLKLSGREPHQVTPTCIVTGRETPGSRLPRAFQFTRVVIKADRRPCSRVSSGIWSGYATRTPLVE